jgi:hypothetical protein
MKQAKEKGEIGIEVFFEDSAEIELKKRKFDKPRRVS